MEFCYIDSVVESCSPGERSRSDKHRREKGTRLDESISSGRVSVGAMWLAGRARLEGEFLEPSLCSSDSVCPSGMQTVFQQPPHSTASYPVTTWCDPPAWLSASDAWPAGRASSPTRIGNPSGTAYELQASVSYIIWGS